MLILAIAAAVAAASLAGGLGVRARLAVRPAGAGQAARIEPPVRWRPVAASVLRPDRPVAVLVVWLMILDAVLALAAPWPLQFVVDYGLSQRPLPGWSAGLNGLGPGGLAAVAAAAGLVLLGASALAGYLVTFLSGVLSERMTLRLRAGVFSHVLHAVPTAVSRYPLGELTSRIGPDVRQVSDTVSTMLETLIPDLVLLAGMTIITALVDWRLTAVVLCVVPLYALAARLRNRSVRGAQRRARARSGELAALAADQLARLRAVHVFDQARAEITRHARAAGESAGAAVAALDASARFRPATEMLPGLGLAAVLVTGTHEVISGHLSIGGLLVFLAYLSSLTGPVHSLARLSGTVACGEASRDRIDELLRLPALEPVAVSPARPGQCARAATVTVTATGTNSVKAAAGRPAARRPGGVTVRLERVSFAHSPGRPVLDQFSACLSSGEMACLTGPSGAGKSTLLALLVRLAEPQSGRIWIDQQDIARLPLRQLRRLVTLVPQDPWLHTGTIADNIRYGQPQASSAQVTAAAERAGVSTFAARLPDGYATDIGEHGMLLSGGQRRRIAIARALLRDTPLLLLDEPTTGLDEPTEAAVTRELLAVVRSKTVIVVTHSLALTRFADRVITVGNGLHADRTDAVSDTRLAV